MPVSSSDIVFYRSATVNDTSANGGLPTASLVVNNAVNNIFPDVGNTERTAGSTKYRKVFLANANTANLTLFDTRLFVENYTGGQDSVVAIAGSFSDTQGGITGTRNYGCGQLAGNVSIGASSIQVTTESAALDYYRVGDTIRISDKADILSVGNEEYHSIATVSYAGDVATIGLVSTLAYGYTATATRVSSLIAVGDLKGQFETSPVVTSASGAFAGSSVLFDNRATPYGNWTITFTGATTFTVAGPNGITGSGTTASTYIYTNPTYAVAGLTIPAATWSGVWQAGDTVTFGTKPALYPLWLRRTVPSGCATAVNNKFILGIDGESA